MAITHVDGEDESEGGDTLLQILIVLFIIMLVVSVGTIGYRVFGEMEWIDAFHNGAMVFTSTSLINPVTAYNGKIFSAFYNLMSGIFVLVIIGVIVRRGLTAAGISSLGISNNSSDNKSNNSSDNKSNNNDDSDDSDSEYTSVFDY